MAFDPGDYDLAAYVERIKIGEQEWFSVKNSEYPPESANPSTGGRFHLSGTYALYAASGLAMGATEVTEGVSDEIPETHTPWAVPSGDYQFFNLARFLDEHPEASDIMNPDDHQDGQRLRVELENLAVSGVFAPSKWDSGGRNMAIWPLNGTPLPSGWLQPRAT